MDDISKGFRTVRPRQIRTRVAAAVLAGLVFTSAGCSGGAAGKAAAKMDKSGSPPAAGVTAASAPVESWEGQTDLLKRLPTGMLLPNYLPKGFIGRPGLRTGPQGVGLAQPKVQLSGWRSGGAAYFFSQGGAHFVSVTYQPMADKDPLLGASNPEEIQEVQVGNSNGISYRDDDGWTVTWAVHGHGYTVKTDISLEEARKVAESIK